MIRMIDREELEATLPKLTQKEFTAYRSDALTRLAQVSDSTLRETCDLVDDLMVNADKHKAYEQYQILQDILIDLVMEEERRASCVQSC